MTSLRVHRFFVALSNWIDQQPHGEGCEFGGVVKSGPLEGNKLPCTCGLTKLQAATNNATKGE